MVGRMSWGSGVLGGWGGRRGGGAEGRFVGVGKSGWGQSRVLGRVCGHVFLGLVVVGGGSGVCAAGVADSGTRACGGDGQGLGFCGCAWWSCVVGLGGFRSRRGWMSGDLFGGSLRCWVGLCPRCRGRYVWGRWVLLNQNESCSPVLGCLVAYLVR